MKAHILYNVSQEQMMHDLKIEVESWALPEKTITKDLAAVLLEPLISHLKSHGYDKWDYIDTSTATSEQRKKFATWHHHTEDEVRFCVDNWSITHDYPLFAFHKGNQVVHLYPAAGDLIIIPANRKHYFLGSGVFMRFFKEASPGWEPIYD